MPDLLILLLYIAIYGFLVYMITQIKMVQPFKDAIVGIAIIALVIWIVMIFTGQTTVPKLVWPFH